MLKVVLVMVFGGVGCVCRYGVALGAQRLASGKSPAGTLLVNVVGCLCAGVAAAYFATRGAGREEWRLAVMSGFLGGFTTFSAFGVETVYLLRRADYTTAAAYVLLSVIAGIGGLWLAIKAVPRGSD